LSAGSPSGPSRPWRTARTVLTAIWLVVVAALTLGPQPTGQRAPTIQQLSACLICGDRGTSDALLNLLLLAPLGFLWNDRGWRPLRVVGTALLMSASIELAQHFIPGRYSNLGDVVWNTTGAWAAAVLWSTRGRWLPGNARDAARLRNLAVAVAPLVTFAFGWLMAPAWPAEPYWGQWTPDLGFMEQYRGRVLEARLDSTPLSSHELPARQHTRNMLMHDWTMEAEVVKGPPPAALAPILNIYDGKQREVTMLGAIRQDLVYRERTRARRFRFDDPALWYPDALAGAAAGDTVNLKVVRRGRSRCLVVNGTEACPAFTPGRAWALLLPFRSLSSRVRESLDAAWVLLLLAPVGFWSVDTRRLAAAGLATAAGVALAVAMTRIVGPPWSEVVAAVVGLVAGHALRTSLTRGRVAGA
jgi:glycopeptide antibiotics resistance protein